MLRCLSRFGTVGLFLASFALALPPTPQIITSFHRDGYTIIANATVNGSRGFVAQSTNVTLLSTGAKKLAYYVEGTAYDMGYLAGILEEEAAGAMTNTYVDHFIVSLISVQLDQECVGARAKHASIVTIYIVRLTSNPLFGGLYDDLVRLLGDFLVMCSVAHFDDDVAAGGIIPTEVITEMLGLLDGCKAANPNTNVTMDRLITLNYGYSTASACVYCPIILSLHSQDGLAVRRCFLWELPVRVPIVRTGRPYVYNVIRLRTHQSLQCFCVQIPTVDYLLVRRGGKSCLTHLSCWQQSL